MYAQQSLKTLASNDGFKLLTDQKEMDGGLLFLIYIIITWNGCLKESLEFPKGSQATCSVWCGSRGGYGA